MNNFWKSFLCVLACVLFCAVSFFTGYFFRDTVKIKQSSEINASCSLKTADTVSNSGWSFTSNSFTIPVSFFSTQNLDSMYSFDKSFLNFSINIGFDTNGLYCSYMTNSIYCQTKDVMLSFVDIAPNYTPITTTFYKTDTEWYNSWQFMRYSGINLLFNYRFSSGFGSFPISNITINKKLDNSMNNHFSGVEFSFNDKNGEYIQLQFVFSNNIQGAFVPERTIFVLENLTDNDYYNQGYSTGYSNGVAVGKTNGFNTGYIDGYDDGVIDGYNDGVNATNSYSFSNLLTAVVNAPVSVFTNLLDFNIMGFNLLSLVAGLLTLGLIVLIIKLCLGGK